MSNKNRIVTLDLVVGVAIFCALYSGAAFYLTPDKDIAWAVIGASLGAFLICVLFMLFADYKEDIISFWSQDNE